MSTSVPSPRSHAVVGVDVGGTFTDCVIFHSARNEVRISKLSSTPDDQAVAVVEAINWSWPRRAWDFDALVLGTTVATNAVLERRGGTVALITTLGFRDVLEMRRRDRPNMWGLRGHFEPIVPRRWSFEVAERVDSSGVVVAEPQHEEVRRVAEAIESADISSVVVSLVNSYANPVNEKTVVNFLRDYLVGRYIVSASEVTREYREFERTSTAVVSAFVQPVVARYLESLQRQVRAEGYEKEVWVVQSNGGRMSLRIASDYCVNTILSGPAAGVVAGQRIGDWAGFTNVVTMDMGGTSLDVGVITDGQVAMTSESSVEFGIPIRLPMVDVHTIGAGGGSVAWMDAEGLLSVGPHSAGAVPGPACYGRGGSEATLTDANIVIGRLGDGQTLGSERRLILNRDLASAALQSHFQDSLGGSPEEIADAIVEIAVRKIAHSISLVTVERGLDPRDYALVAFGGAGALHVCQVMREVGFRRAVIPRFPGLTSALGCILGAVRHDFTRSVGVRLGEMNPAQLESVVADHVETGRALLEQEGIDPASAVIGIKADMNYDGQTHILQVPLDRNHLNAKSIQQSFEETYIQRFGRAFPTGKIVVETIRTAVSAPPPPVSFSGIDVFVEDRQVATAPTSKPRPPHERKVWCGDGFEEWPVYERHTLGPTDSPLVGPLIVEQEDATCVVDRDFGMLVDPNLSLIIIDEAGS